MSRERLPAIGLEIAAHVEAALRAEGLNDRAQEVSDRIAERLVLGFAGQAITFPADPFRDHDLAQRNAEICLRFDGHNAADLARQYRLSRQRIWQIVKSMGCYDLR